MTPSARRGFAAIVAGTASGQAMVFLGSPVLTRVFRPADFGVFAVVAAIAMCATSLASLRLELAVPLPKSESSAYSLAAMGLLASLTTAAVMSPLLAVLGPHLGRVPGAGALVDWLWLVPIIAAAMGAYLLLNALAIRQGRFSAIGRRNFLQSAATVAAQIAGGLVGFHAGGLLGGMLVGQLIGVASLLRGGGLRSPLALEGFSLHQVRQSFRAYRRFSLALVPAGILNILGLQIVVILIGALYGAASAGWLGLAQRVLAVPVTLVGQAAAQVYLSELAKSRREGLGQERHIFRTTSAKLASVGLLGAAALVALAPWAFGLVFGPGWEVSGAMAQGLAIALFFQLVASPVSQTLIVFERTMLQFAWDVARLVLVVVVIIGGWWLGLSVVATVWAYSCATAGAYLLSWEMSRRTVLEAASASRG